MHVNFNAAPNPFVELQVHCNNKIHEVKMAGSATVGEYRFILDTPARFRLLLGSWLERDVLYLIAFRDKLTIR